MDILLNLETSLPKLLTARYPSCLPSLHSVLFADSQLQVVSAVRLEIRHLIDVGHLEQLWSELFFIEVSLRNKFSWFSHLHTGHSLFLITPLFFQIKMALEVEKILGVGMGPEVERVEDQNVPRTR